MTNKHRPRPRVSTAAVLAPAAAAVLAGSLAWAATNPPPPPTKTATTVSPSGDPSAGRAGLSQDIERLRAEVRSLRAELGYPANSTTNPKPGRSTPPPVHATTGAS
jgi:hypothetical protein